MGDPTATAWGGWLTVWTARHGFHAGEHVYIWLNWFELVLNLCCTFAVFAALAWLCAFITHRKGVTRNFTPEK